MATKVAQIIFYEKLGCINNTRQKKILRKAGHTVVAKNLLTEDWNHRPDQLYEFFGEMPVNEWFNLSAPSIKERVVNPNMVSAHQAVNLMLCDPLLIKRPLMQVEHNKMVGFNIQEVEHWVGLKGAGSLKDVENCPKIRGETDD